jgi:hypothetical protein
MEKRKLSSASYFRMLMILFGAMLMSQVGMAVVFVYLTISQEIAEDPALMHVLVYVVPVLACSMIGLSFVLFSKMVNAASEKSALSDKLRGFQTAMIIRMALLEAPAILAAVSIFLTGSIYFLVVNAVSVLMFALMIPRKEKAIASLRLSASEIDIVNDPEAIVMEYEVGDAD